LVDLRKRERDCVGVSFSAKEGDAEDFWGEKELMYFGK